MDMTFTGRGVAVTDEVRSQAAHKLGTLERMEPRLTGLDLEFISEHHPTVDGVTRVEAALRIPRKTFRAHAEAQDVSSALDEVKDKLERQLRDHHGRRKAVHRPGVGSPDQSPSTADDGDGDGDGS